MKTVCFEKIIICCSAVFLSAFVTSCIRELEQEGDGDIVLGGVPMSLEVGFEGDDALTKSDTYVWPDGATLYIEEPYGSKIGTNYKIYAVYKEDSGWKAYNLSGNEGDSECSVYYSESWCYVGNDDYGSSRRLQATSGAYGGKATCSYMNGTLHLKAVLTPLYGRVRFVSDLLIDVEYKHSENYLKGFSCKNVPSTDYLVFHKENGRYYSDYIYTNVIPEIRIGDYVYKYRGNRIIQSGESGCISLPTTNETTSNWLCEKYLEVTFTNKYVSLNTDGYEYVYYQLYAQQNGFGSDSGRGDSEKGVYGKGPNVFPSAIGLNMYVDWTLQSSYGNNPQLIINCVGGDGHDAKGIYSVGERKSIEIHACNTVKYGTVTAEGCVPYVFLKRKYDDHSDSYSNSAARITFHEIKLSNF